MNAQQFGQLVTNRSYALRRRDWQRVGGVDRFLKRVSRDLSRRECVLAALERHWDADLLRGVEIEWGGGGEVTLYAADRRALAILQHERASVVRVLRREAPGVAQVRIGRMMCAFEGERDGEARGPEVTPGD